MATKRALICEDDEAIRELVKVVLEREGFDADVASDGNGGMEKMASGCYDIVILDLMMPRVDGYAVVDFIRNRRPANLKRVIVMTALRETTRIGFPEPVCKVLLKPFDIDELTAAVHSCARACDESTATAGA